MKLLEKKDVNSVEVEISGTVSNRTAFVYVHIKGHLPSFCVALHSLNLTLVCGVIIICFS